MYAIVNIAGQQFKVEENQEIYVHRQKGNEGDKVEFADVLLKDIDGQVTVGSPVIEDSTISATIVGHLRGDKILVFKKKRRKNYRLLKGHRQYFTKIKIDKIS